MILLMVTSMFRFMSLSFLWCCYIILSSRTVVILLLALLD